MANDQKIDGRERLMFAGLILAGLTVIWYITRVFRWLEYGDFHWVTLESIFGKLQTGWVGVDSILSYVLDRDIGSALLVLAWLLVWGSSWGEDKP